MVFYFCVTMTFREYINDIVILCSTVLRATVVAKRVIVRILHLFLLILALQFVFNSLVLIALNFLTNSSNTSF